MTPRHSGCQRAIALYCAAAAALIGLLVLMGWALEIDVLVRIDPALPPMVANTALMASALGAAMCLHAAGSRFARHATTLACVAVLLLGGATLAQYVLSVDLGIDGLLSTGASESVSRFPGRPAPQSAFALVLLAGAVLAGRSGGRWTQRVAPALAWAAAAIVTGSLLSYLLGVDYISDGSTAFRMGVPSLVSLALMSIAAFCLLPDSAPASWYVRKTAGAVVARQIMPWALLLPVVAATIVARGAQSGAWSDEFALCLLALAALGVIQALIAGGVAAAGRNEELRAALERESRADRRRFTTLTSRAPIGIFETDTTGRTTYVNEALLEIVGLDLASALHGGVREAVHSEDRERVVALWRACTEHGQDFTHEHRLRRRDGEVRWVVAHSTPLTDDDGRATGHLGSVLDVTDRHLADERTRAVVDRVAEAISVIGPDGVHVQVNPAAQAILDDLSERYEQRPLGDVDWGTVRPDGTAVANEQLPAEITRQTGREIDEEVLGFPGAGGDVRWLRISTRRLSGEQAPYGVIVSFTDVTEQRETAARLQEVEERYQTVVAALHEGVIAYAASGEIVASNPRAQELLGLSREQLLGRTPLDPRWRAVREDGTPWTADELPTARALSTGREQLGAIVGVHTPDDETRWMRVNATPLPASSGEPAGVVTSFVDITEQRARERALAAAEERFRTVFEAAPIGMSLTNLAGTKIAVNPALARILDRPAETLVGLPIDEHIHPDDRAASLAAFARLAFGEQRSYRAEERVLNGAGEPVWVQLDATLLRDADGEPAAVLRQVQDISDRRHHEEQLHHLAHHDTLTGLLNRRGFTLELDRHAGHAERYGADGALLIFDLDGFKQVNDMFGHQAGDDVIAAVAEVMRRRLRATDVPARFGGDEFAVLIPRGGLPEARTVAAALLEAIRGAHLAPADSSVTVTASMGIATFEGRAGAAAILADADLAMYDAKRGGGDRSAHRAPAPSASSTR
ncbi:MAG TPA: PAS domain S-box protein [Solirubrobacteraceae bacterium]|nr:PAS domain S-box protein [Solirubrobacteraceae bacterium]